MTEKDLTHELIQALARAKTRGVQVSVVGNVFSSDFLYGPVQAELNRAGIVVHYKIGVGDGNLLGFFDDTFRLMGSFNYTRSAEEAILADNDPGRLNAFVALWQREWERSSEKTGEFDGTPSGLTGGAFVQAIDAARSTIKLSVTEKDLTHELIQALARAKTRGVQLEVRGGIFSSGFSKGSVQAELARAGIAVRYEREVGDDEVDGVVHPGGILTGAERVGAVDAARVTISLSVTEKDLTHELIQALARAKARGVKVGVGGRTAFSSDFLYGPVQAELRRAGVVVHYKTRILDDVPVSKVSFSPGGIDRIALIDKAQTELSIAWSPGLSPGSPQFDRALYEALNRAKARGVKATVMTDPPTPW